MFLLDTCTVTYADEGSMLGDQVRQRIRDAWDDVYICPIVIEERLQGLLDSIRKNARQEPVWQYSELCSLVARLSVYKMALYDTDAVEHYHRLRGSVRGKIGTNDCRIAAVAAWFRAREDWDERL